MKKATFQKGSPSDPVRPNKGRPKQEQPAKKQVLFADMDPPPPMPLKGLRRPPVTVPKHIKTLEDIFVWIRSNTEEENRITREALIESSRLGREHFE